MGLNRDEHRFCSSVGSRHGVRSDASILLRTGGVRDAVQVCESRMFGDAPVPAAGETLPPDAHSRTCRPLPRHWDTS